MLQPQLQLIQLCIIVLQGTQAGTWYEDGRFGATSTMVTNAWPSHWDPIVHGTTRVFHKSADPQMYIGTSECVSTMVALYGARCSASSVRHTSPMDLHCCTLTIICRCFAKQLRWRWRWRLRFIPPEGIAQDMSESM